jgi:hypothetical protein
VSTASVGISGEPTDPVLALLAQSPGLKTLEIARRLGADRREINSALYGRLKRQVRQDTSYRWFLREGTTPPPSGGAEEAVKQNTALSRLSAYYLACLALDDTGGVSVFARDLYGRPDYVELAEHPLVEGSEADPFDSADGRRLLGKLRKDRRRSSLYLGFPVRLKRVRSAKWEGCFVEPIFLVPFDTGEGHSGASPLLEPELTTLNAKALEKLVAVDSGSALDEVILLTEELGLDQAGSIEIEVDELYHRLRDLRSGWDWKEEPDPFQLTADRLLQRSSSPASTIAPFLCLASGLSIRRDWRPSSRSSRLSQREAIARRRSPPGSTALLRRVGRPS